MNENFIKKIQEALGTSNIYQKEKIQDLWGGYGSIVRYASRDNLANSVIVKHIRFPAKISGRESQFSHDRKINSYNVELSWYNNWSSRCNEKCRIPKLHAFDRQKGEFLLVMEDLDSAGFSQRKHRSTIDDIKTCLSWLANFHGTFYGEKPSGIWRTGTYWHLEARPEEHKLIADKNLKNAASTINEKLSNCTYKTLVHGDAKLENFCFSRDSKQVAAVDFQYVGGGCGMKDVAYLLECCLDDSNFVRLEPQLLTYYFDVLKESLRLNNKTGIFDELQQEWRTLYPYAVADFNRFLKGWGSGAWAISQHGERLTRDVISQLYR